MFIGGADAATAQARLATAAVIWAAGLTARRLPLPEATPLDRADAVVDWIMSARRRGGGRCVLQTYVSQAVRVSQAASARGLDLNGVLFIVGSEPLTEAKQRAIVNTEAQVYSRYATTEIGMLGIGCGRPMEAGDLHLVSDSIACIHGTEDAGTAAPYHFTTLLPQSPVVMLNVQMGDAGFLERQHCGCLLDDLGLGVHLRQVRSFSRATGEGVAWFRPELQRIVEELLPARYGGSPLDYQWVEAEDERALTRLLLRVHPRLGPLDTDAIAEDVLAELSRGHAARRIPVERWRQAGTVRVVRQPPQSTSRGKMLPILQERPANGVRGKQ